MFKEIFERKCTDECRVEEVSAERSSEREVQRGACRKRSALTFNTPRAPSGPERIYLAQGPPQKPVSGAWDWKPEAKCLVLGEDWEETGARGGAQTEAQRERGPNISAPGPKAPEAC